MRLFLLSLLRILLSFALIQFVYDTTTGNSVNPFHPFNFIGGWCFLTSFIFIWFRSYSAHAISAFTAIIWSIMVIIQIATLAMSFPMDSLKADFLWFELKGNLAGILLLGLPGIVMILSFSLCLPLLMDLSYQGTPEKNGNKADSRLNKKEGSYQLLFVFPISLVLLTGLIGIPKLIHNWDYSRFNPAYRNRGVIISDLQPSESEYSSIAVGYVDDLQENGSIYFNAKGVSVEYAISSLQNMGIIKSIWVINRNLLPEGLYDIHFGDIKIPSRSDIPDLFFQWIDQNFSISIEEKVVLQKVKFCEFPIESKRITLSSESSPSRYTEFVNDEFGMQFKGVTIFDFCEWLTSETGDLFIVGPGETSPRKTRYDFFLPCFPSQNGKDSIFKGLRQLKIKTTTGKAEIESIVVSSDRSN